MFLPLLPFKDEYMVYSVITNNKSLEAVLHTFPVQVQYIEGHIKDVTFMARDLLMQGYVLVADPLAGRLERPSPYVSYFLKKVGNNSKLDEEILRIEYFVALHHEHAAYFLSLDERHKQDFALIDTSLIVNCARQVFAR